MICPRCNQHCGGLFPSRHGDGACRDCWTEDDAERGGTLPADEWADLGVEGRKAARAKGIRPRSADTPGEEKYARETIAAQRGR